MATPMRTLMQAVQTRLQSLTADMALQVKGGDPRPPVIHLYRLPNANRSDLTADLCPFAVIVPMASTDSERLGSVSLRIIACCYNEGENGAGDADVEELSEAVLKISAEQQFAPYALLPEIKCTFGDQETGAQDHPQYFLAVDLTFVRESVYLNN